VSTGAQIAVLEPRGVRRPRARSEVRAAERPLVRLGAFGALGLYGVLRWGTLLSPAPIWRLLGLLALALMVAGPGRALGARSRSLAIVAAAVAVVVMFVLAGIPFAWVRHVRIAVSADAIGQGLSSLPGVLVPYTGINEWVRMVTVLGAGVLLLDAALMLAFAPRSLGELRRASAALPLVALAVVPSTLARPQLPYLHGLILFALLAAFIWGERVSRYDYPLAIAVAVLVGAAAMIAAPALDQHGPWLDYESLAGGLSPGHVEAFDWSQRYGPLNWPRTGREVLDVQAQRGDYWKAEDLDLFTGTGWSQGDVGRADSAPPQPDRAALARWTQTIQVTIRAMRTTDVIAAGVASPPAHLAEAVVRGQGAGTWMAGADLQPGDSYRITTYSPTPTAAQLAAAGAEPSGPVLAGYRSILLPPAKNSLASPEIIFPPFHSDLQVTSVIGIYGANGATVVRSSPYGRAFALARRLASRAATPAAFVANVQRYLQHGYSYNENPPASQYPLETFLFRDKIGYCQQFSGAMALLLRMGGIPARVAAGFTTGRYDNATHQWLVSDRDAHAWVEAWFPRYGWVRFDPTPAAAPARGGHVPLPALHGATGAAAAAPHPVKKKEQVPALARVPSTTHGGGPSAVLIGGAIALALVLLALALRAFTRPAQPSGDELLAELERALARCGRPISDGITLAALEHRFRSAPEAAEYIHRIRLVRFGGASQLPTPEQRRALRAQLRAGLGAVGRLRALWALPPKWTRSGRAWIASGRGIQSK
jgi:protein-glutamine gamma-glutamyltransferase